jgi:hypothetical protein
LSYLHDLPMDDCIREWDRLDEGGTNLAAMRALCLDDLFYLLVKICSIGKVKSPNKDGSLLLLHPWIYARCREFESDPNGYVDLWAREHFKSTIITFGGTIQAILNDPELTVGIFSQSGSIASGFLMQIKAELENNDTLKLLFPDILYENPWKDAPKWSSDGIIVKRNGNPKECTIEASGLVDGMPVGRHYQLMVYDDVVTQASVSTKEMIDKTTNAFELSLSMGREGGLKRIIGTRYNLIDTYHTIIERKTGIPRLYAATDNGQPDGEPVMLGAEYWASIVRDTSSTNLACQYLQNPAAGLEKMFDIEDLQYYEVRPRTLNVYIMVDPARSMKKGSDKTAIAVIGIDSAKNKYLLDGMNHNMPLSDRWQWLKFLYLKWKKTQGVQRVYVGYEGYGSGSVDVEYIKEQMRNDVSFEIAELYWPKQGPGSKIDRVGRLEPDFRNHKFYIPYPTNKDKLTDTQKEAMSAGLDGLVSKRILRKTVDGVVYDVTKELVGQVEFFPKGKVDLIDAVSRIYDMEPRPPMQQLDPDMLEPRYI